MRPPTRRFAAVAALGAALLTAVVAGAAPAQAAERPVADALLAPAELPAGDGAFRQWKIEATYPDEGQALFACQQNSLASTGAVEQWQRAFTAREGQAGQAVLRYPNAIAAAGAEQRIAGWLTDCARALDARGGTLLVEYHTTSTADGTTVHHVGLADRAGGERTVAEDVVTVRDGDRLSLMTTSTRTDSFLTGEQETELVKALKAKLAG